MEKSKKFEHLNMLADYRHKLRLQPDLRYLFFELTMRCNERCLHCGSYCGDVKSEEMPVEVYYKLLDQVKRDFKKLPMICITGGEPLLRKEFFDIMNYAKKLGYGWGMTSNGTLITDEVAAKLKDAGMKTVSISIDGMEESHDAFRRTPGGYKKAVEAVRNLLKYDFQAVQVTSVITKKTIGELPQLFALMEELDVDSWRVINLEPIGRALSLKDYMLDADDYRYLMEYIRSKRADGYPVTYGCSHYLGINYEREVRDWYFLCTAGIYTASIMANGDIGACLDIERRPETIMGNVLKDDFTQVWMKGFDIFRKPLSDLNEECSRCDSRYFCEGGAHHSWDYQNNKPLVCFKNVLF